MTYKEFFEQFPSLRVDDFRTALLGKSPLTQECGSEIIYS